ncbi:phosphoglycerate mutase-like protein [Xylaria sp. FL0064]|nr:phosphoglycerate mutase-like protein [Xylaria sp. FL0064]
MLATLFLAFLSLGTTSLAVELDELGKWDQHHKSTINYTTVTGFFLQDDPTTDPTSFDYTTVNYGLITRSYPTDGEFDRQGKKTQWQRFEHYVETINRDADKGTQYKVLFMARHGKGYHNAAESYYGTPAWNCYWGPLDGNGTKHALTVAKIPAPHTYYSSPLTRSTTTANLTFAGLDLPHSRPFAPTVKELLREGISIRSCDERSSKTALSTLLPNFRFEEGFSETDLLWRGHEAEGETDEAQARRAKTVIDDIFGHDANTWISLTTHSGQIAMVLKVLGHRVFGLSTGQAIPVLVRAKTIAALPDKTLTSFTSEPTCLAPPVTSIQGQGCMCSSVASTIVSAAATPTAAWLVNYTSRERVTSLYDCCV